MVADFDCVSALRAMGEEIRLRLLRCLLNEPHSVNELADMVHEMPYNISRHLRVLRQAGLVVVQKQAQQRFYMLTPAIRARLSKNGKVLDLGCCQFHFDKLHV